MTGHKDGYRVLSVRVRDRPVRVGAAYCLRERFVGPGGSRWDRAERAPDLLLEGGTGLHGVDRLEGAPVLGEIFVKRAFDFGHSGIEFVDSGSRKLFCPGAQLCVFAVVKTHRDKPGWRLYGPQWSYRRFNSAGG